MKLMTIYYKIQCWKRQLHRRTTTYKYKLLINRILVLFQTPGTFDVTLLMPHRYGGVSELHQPMGPGFSHFTTPDHFEREGLHHDRSRAFDFFGNNPEEGDDEDEDYLMGSRSMGNSGSNSGGNSVLNASMGSGGTPTNSEVRGSGAGENGSTGGLMDLLSLRLPQRRSQSRLSTVIQVRPYGGGGTGRPVNEGLRTGREREDSVDSQDTDEDEIKEADMDDDETGIGESRSMRSFRVKPAARVSRSKSFNLLSTQSPMMQGAPTSNSLSPSPHPRGYSGLSPNHSPRRDVPFIPRKLSSTDMYSTSEIRRSRVTL